MEDDRLPGNQNCRLMKHVKRNFVIVATVAIAMLSFVTMPGGEFYRISMNGKQVIEQFLTRNTEIPTLHIDKFADADQLSVYYNHCGKIGTNRVLSLKSGNNILKSWNFKNSNADMMTLDMKDVVSAGATKQPLQLYYSSSELKEGRLLAKVELSSNIARRQ